MCAIAPLAASSKLVGRNNSLFALVGANWPTGSIKYISVLGMLAHLRNRGALEGCRRLYASTSGNTGLAAAHIGSRFGLALHAVVDARIEPEKLANLIAAGAEIIKVEGDVLTRIRVAANLAEGDPQGADLNQYDNEGALLGHFQVTGPQIWQSMAGRVDAVVVALGTGGTFGGIASYLTKQNPGIATIPVDCRGSMLIDGKPGKRLLTGIGCGFVPKNVQRAYQHIRGTPFVATDADSIAAARWLLEEEGVGVGGSGGAVLCAAMDYASRVTGKRIAIVFHDGASSYCSTIFSDKWIRENGFKITNRGVVT